MNTRYKQIDYNRLWSPSGDPFVDAGGYALKFLSEKFPDKDILELIEFATDIYVDRWGAKLNSIFLNSKITNPSCKAKKSETIDFFKRLIEGEEKAIRGFCRIFGVETELYPAGRNLSVLSGSGKFTNFHHSFEEGLMFSKEVIIRYHFLPLGCEMLLKDICVISSNRAQTAELYATECCSRILMAVGQNNSVGILKNEARSESTAIFRFVEKLLSHYTDYENKETISLFHFSNFGANPNLKIYTLPFQAFYFYTITQRYEYKTQWNNFVSRYYKSKNFKYDDERDSYISSIDKKIIEKSQYEYWRNVIYDKLLKSQSIIYEIREWSKENIFDRQLFANYLNLVHKMKSETLDKLNEIADFIITDTQNVEKTIKKLNGISSAYLLKRFIVQIAQKNYTDGNEKAIITVKDYTEYLFPETSSWRETRDILLIALYQKLHEKNITIEIDESIENDDFTDDAE